MNQTYMAAHAIEIILKVVLEIIAAGLFFSCICCLIRMVQYLAEVHRIMKGRAAGDWKDRLCIAIVSWMLAVLFGLASVVLAILAWIGWWS